MRRSIYIDEFAHKSPIPNASRIGNIIVSGLLRGVDPATTRAALEDILKKLKARNISVLLCGMYAPPNLGPDYGARFNSIYPELAKAYNVPLYPFFLDGVNGDAKLTQPDGLHPTAQGVDMIVNGILPTVERFLAGLPRSAS